MTFRRLLLCVLVTCALSAAAQNGGRRVVVEPAQSLTAADREELAAKGLRLGRVVAGGKFLGRLHGNVDDPRIRSIEPLGSAMKIHRSAIREALRGKAFAAMAVTFHDDVTLDDARAAIADAGGTLDDTLPVNFEKHRRVIVHLPSNAVEQLARDERVLAIAGGAKRRVRPHNAQAALVTGVADVRPLPYGLTGAGVRLGVSELSGAQTTHPDFGGRFSSHIYASDPEIAHATHVAGTMAGSGAGNANAKGMAPAATLDLFGIDFWQESKTFDFLQYRIDADNNSWGYVLGWSEFDGQYWVFENYEEYFGAYDTYYTGPLDDITLDTGTLIVVSAGNDGENPTLPSNGAHRHYGSASVYCHSGCGFWPCSSNTCERQFHMQSAPYGTVGDMASAKNIITVGAVNSSTKTLEPYSSRGPALDGRIKPELVAPGASLFSTLPPNTYGVMSGTSMAAPVVTGIAGLAIEQWRLTFNGARPRPDQIKALLIATAEDLGTKGPDYAYGFGLVDAKAAVDLVRADGGVGRHLRSGAVAESQTYEFQVVAAAGETVRVVLSWSDPAITYLYGENVATPALVNDLDVKVIAPNGTTWLPYALNGGSPTTGAVRTANRVDNTELVEIANAAAGLYRIVVTGTSLPDGSSAQQFALVSITAGVAPIALTATATAAPTVELTWNAPVPGATYSVWRRVTGGSFVLRASNLTQTAWTDNNVAPNLGYLYRIDATWSGGAAQSNVDAATTVALPAFSGAIALQHLVQLREALNAVRSVAGLPAMNWIEAPYAGGPVKAMHLADLRTAANSTRAALGKAAATFTPSVTAGTTVIRASDFAQIADAVK